MLPAALLKPVLIAGTMLCIMSIVDTLAYGVRTAGVLTRKLAISLSLFNILVMASRWSNLLSAPILGNFPDKVYQGAFTTVQVLAALRIDLLFVIAGVVLGALLMPSLIRLFERGISLLEEKGTLPRTIWYGLSRLPRLPSYFSMPGMEQVRAYSNFRVLPYQFLIYNIFVTCFYSIGVMSTVLAASLDHSVAGTAILLSGIVNGIATMTLFMIVDPPGAVVVEQCISGKRPISHAKTMNVTLVITRLLGTILALVLLPAMAQYVLVTAHWVDHFFAAKGVRTLGQASASAEGLDYGLKVTQQADGSCFVQLRVNNPSPGVHAVVFSSGATHRFVLAQQGRVLWDSSASTRSTQALRSEDLEGHGTRHYDETIPAGTMELLDPSQPFSIQTSHELVLPVQLQLTLSLNAAMQMPAPNGDRP